MSKSEESEIKEPEKPAIHNLFSREIRPIRNWCEWLERWQVAGSLEEMLGLLHAAFQVSLESCNWEETKYDHIDRIEFFFKIADGWNDSYLLHDPKDGEKVYITGFDKYGNAIKETPSKLRQRLAQKALDMLCQNFFKEELLDEQRQFRYVWEKIIVSERLFPVILNFFRPKEGRFSNDRIRNLSRRERRSHNEQQVVDFFLRLARFIWGWEEYEIHSYDSRKEEMEKHNISMRARIDAAKPWMIEILSELGELKLLHAWMFDLDKPCLAKLKEIALRAELRWNHPVSKERPVATLDEACFVGSEAAWFLKEHELKTKEHKRLGAIRDEENRIETSGRRIRDLTTKT